MALALDQANGSRALSAIVTADEELAAGWAPAKRSRRARRRAAAVRRPPRVACTFRCGCRRVNASPFHPTGPESSGESSEGRDLGTSAIALAGKEAAHDGDDGESGDVCDSLPAHPQVMSAAAGSCVGQNQGELREGEVPGSDEHGGTMPAGVAPASRQVHFSEGTAVSGAAGAHQEVASTAFPGLVYTVVGASHTSGRCKGFVLRLTLRRVASPGATERTAASVLMPCLVFVGWARNG